MGNVKQRSDKTIFKGEGIRRQPLTIVLAFLACWLTPSIVFSSEHERNGQYDQSYRLTIPSQELDRALIALATETGHALVMPSEDVGSLRSTSIDGTYTLLHALQIMLDGTDLSGGLTESGVITISLTNTENDGETNVRGLGRKGSLLAGVSAVLFGLGGPAPEALAQIDEIIVTATKRESGLQRTPIAVTALDSSLLRDAGVSGPLDLNGLAPSTVISRSVQQLQITIRGVGNEIIISGVGEPGVAFHTNGVFNGSNVSSTLGFLDVDRIEILRGPQGTLWGRNSTGGAVNVIQKRPTEDFEGYLAADYGRFNTLSAESAVSGPLTDSLLGRFAVSYRRSDGYIENLVPGQPDVADDNTVSFRGSLLAKFSDTTEWLVAAGYAYSDITAINETQQGTAFPPGVQHPFSPAAALADPVTFAPTLANDGSRSFAEINRGFSATQGTFTTFNSLPDSNEATEAYYFTSEFVHDFASLSLTLLTDYRYHDRQSVRDIDFTPSTVFEDFSFLREDTQQFSQEVRLSSDGWDRFDWLVGGYFYFQNLDIDNDTTVGPYPGSPDVVFGGAFGPAFPQATFVQAGNQKTTSYAIFGQSNYRLIDDVSVTLGARFSSDQKKGDERSIVVIGERSGLVIADTTANFDENWQEVTWKAGLEYTPADEILIYANVANGYKSGGINLGSLTGAFDPETLINYELGIKSTFLDKRARLNLTGFYSDYKDYQLQSILNTALIITNADAEIYGVEAEFTLIPLENWKISAVASWNESEITSYNQAGLLNPATNDPVVAGEPLPRTPDFAFRVAAERYVQLNDDLTLDVKASYRWQDDVNLDAFGTFGASQDSYGIFDALLRLHDSESVWSIDVYGNNLTNKFYKESVFTFSTVIGSNIAAGIGEPRTYGVRLRTEF